MRAHMTSGSIKKNKIHHQAALVSVSLPHPREPTMWLLLAVSDDSDVHTAIIACIQNRTQNNGAQETKEGMEKQGGGSATTASHRNDVAVATTAITTRRGSSNNSGTLPGKMK